MLTRKLGRSGLEVSALGMGCWAIGGSSLFDGKRRGWGDVDDNESIRAIHAAVEMGVTFFDTADAYGSGRSERVLGTALEGRRDQVVLCTKFGKLFNEEKGERIEEIDASESHIRRACEASLRRLKTDYIDLYLFHSTSHDLEDALRVRHLLEQLVSEGKIRWYGWSTDDAERAALFAEGTHGTAVQHEFNIFEGNRKTLAVSESTNMVSICRSPLAMGLLTGKFTVDSKLSPEDIRYKKWDLKGKQAEHLDRLQLVRDVLTADGRTLVQGAIGWIWAASASTVPIPGFKTVAQVQENAGTLAYGPLSVAQMQQIDELLGR
jgi:aryl-alcohol dehydrogenase-like predicted oxidoreductase